MEGNTQKEQGISLITYEDAVKNAEILQTINWDLAVFDEADFCLNRKTKRLKLSKIWLAMLLRSF